MGRSDEGLEDRDHRTPPSGCSGGWNLVPGEHKTVGLQRGFEGNGGTYVVQLSMVRPNPQVPAVTVVTAEALISFSVAGNTVTRRVSVGPGVSIAGNCEHVEVRITDTTPEAVLPDVVDEVYRVNVLVSKGMRASTGQPPTLDTPGVNETSLAGGASATFVVPQDAGVVSVHVDVSSTAGAPLADNAVQVQQLSDAAATFFLKSYDPRTHAWVPVVPGCTIIRITNRTAAQLIRVRPTFGIDG